MVITSRKNISVTPIAQSKLSSVNLKEVKFGSVFSDHMFIADYRDGKWQNTSIIPYGNMEFGPAMSALNYGQTIFEGMKAYKDINNNISLFRPLDHLHRLNRSAERLCMEQIPEEIFMSGLLELINLDKNWVPDGGSLYIRPLYFATDELLGVKESETYRLVIFTSPVYLYYSANLKVWVSTNFTRAAEGGIGYVKTAGNYARALAESRKARQEGYNVVLWLDAQSRKFVEEYSTMNAFFVIDNVVVTPPLTGTILEGITRDSIIKILKDEGFTVSEREISIDEVTEAIETNRLTEAFGSGTAAIAAPVEEIRLGNKSWHLPPTDNWDVFMFIRQRLNEIRTGLTPDQYGWMVRVD